MKKTSWNTQYWYNIEKVQCLKKKNQKIVNLIKNLEITGINQVWTTDITYIKT